MPDLVCHCVPRGAAAERGGGSEGVGLVWVAGKGAILPNSKGRDEAPEEAVLCPGSAGPQPEQAPASLVP